MNDEEERLSIGDYLTMVVDAYISLDLNSWQSIMGWIVAFLLSIFLIIMRSLGYRKEHSSQECLIDLKDKKLTCLSAEDLQKCLAEINLKCEEYVDKYSTIEYTLTILSILNVVYLWWWSYKIYHLFSRKKDETPDIPNVNLVGIDLPWYARNRFGYFIFQQYYELNYDQPYEGRQKVWEIYVWNPNKFFLNLLYGFSPVQVGILMIMNKDTEIYSIILSGFLALQMYFYAEKFISLVRDKEIIFRELQREYDMKFVKPRVFRRKKNVDTQTTPQGEMMRELLCPKPNDEQRYRYPKRFDNPWVINDTTTI